MSPGYSLRSGGYGLRSKGASPIKNNQFPDPPKSRSMGKRKVLSLPTDTEQKLDPDEEEKRYLEDLAESRKRRPRPSSGSIYPQYNNYYTRLKPSTSAEKLEAITDPEKYFLGKSENLKKLSQNFAAEAISYLRQTDSNWELVKACMYQGQAIARCDLAHVNFQAKRPNEPVQTFFAQVRYGQRHTLYEIDCCVNLGPSDSLPERRDNQGCLFCSKYVHHPRGGFGGWSNGWPDWDFCEELRKSDAAAVAASKKK